MLGSVLHFWMTNGSEAAELELGGQVGLAPARKVARRCLHRPHLRCLQPNFQFRTLFMHFAEDVFAFGIVMHEMLSWQLPWGRRDPWQASGGRAVWCACMSPASEPTLACLAHRAAHPLPLKQPTPAADCGRGVARQPARPADR